MNWDRIEGEWKQRRGKAVRHWGKMMNDDLAGAAGRYEQLVGELQERYGNISEAAAEHVERIRTIAGDLKKTNRNLAALLESMTRIRGGNGIRKATAAGTKPTNRKTGKKKRP